MHAPPDLSKKETKNGAYMYISDPVAYFSLLALQIVHRFAKKIEAEARR